MWWWWRVLGGTKEEREQQQAKRVEGSEQGEEEKKSISNKTNITLTEHTPAPRQKGEKREKQQEFIRG